MMISVNYGKCPACLNGDLHSYSSSLSSSLNTVTLLCNMCKSTVTVPVNLTETGKPNNTPLSIFDIEIKPKDTFTKASDFIENLELSKIYLSNRSDDATSLIKQIHDQNGILHYCVISRSIMSADSNTIFVTFNDDSPIVRFKHPECCLAYILARYW